MFRLGLGKDSKVSVRFRVVKVRVWMSSGFQGIPDLERKIPISRNSGFSSWRTNPECAL